MQYQAINRAFATIQQRIELYQEKWLFNKSNFTADFLLKFSDQGYKKAEIFLTRSIENTWAVIFFPPKIF